MRVIFSILILLLILTSCNYQNNTSGSDANINPDSALIKSETQNIDTSIEDSIKIKLGINDSIKVLTYENHPDWHVYVFIDYNRDSKLYEHLDNSFNITGDILNYVNEELGEFDLKTNDSISQLLRTDYDFLLKNWVELFSLDTELYVIDACEFVGEYYLTDSVFYDGYFMDVPELSIIENVVKLNDKKTRLHLKTLRGKEMTLDFYEIDNRGTYLVDFTGKFNKNVISYMTTSDKVRNYDLVYHDCTDMTDKYEFDTPDYESIITELNK